MGMLDKWREQARRLKIECYTLYLAYRDPRTPWYARIFAACVVGYAFSPIDLIPDFVPIIGYLDDLILLPIGITVALKLIPVAVLDECREKARSVIDQGKPINRVAAALIVILWLGLALLVTRFLISMVAQ